MTGLPLLEQRIKYTAIQSFIVSACSAAIVVLLLAALVFEALHRQWGSAGFIGFMCLIGLLATVATAASGLAMWPARRSKLYRMFETEPGKIAWVYVTVGKHNGLKIHTIDGGEDRLAANGADSKNLMALVQACAPDAILGYGPEQQKAYRERVAARHAAR
jgi:uncharacterized SAM-binding protein YcdF (DUF218 family)